MTSGFKIAGRSVGAGFPPYVVAEMSANHGGSIEQALATIEAAKACGADAVKLQTYTPDTMTIDHDGPEFFIQGGLWDGRRLYELYQEAHTPWDWHQALFYRAKQIGITVFSTPFDETAVNLLESLEVPVYKVSSFELVDLPLVRQIAATGKPTIMSTGMASSEEIDEAVEAFRSEGGQDLILLHCISGYPTPPDESNLRRIPELERRYGCAVGLSDHTLGFEIAVASVALNTCLIEKHFTLDRSAGGPDSAFSLEPIELQSLVGATAAAFRALGNGSDQRSAVEKTNMQFRRSIYAVADIAAGEIFTKTNIRSIRPGYGLAPKHLPEVIGRVAARPITRGTPLDWTLVQ
jgi:N-acetylneuraminate synthase